MDAQTIFSGLLIASQVTVEVTVGAWIFSAIVGLMFALLRDLGVPVVTLPLSMSVTLLRSVPQLVVLYLLYFGVGALGVDVSPLPAAIVALGLTEGAFVAEYYRASFKNIPATQRDAGLSLGLSPVGVLRLVVIPQAIPFAVPPLLNSFVGLLKAATLASSVGVPEILFRAQNEMSRTGEIMLVMTLVIAMYVVVTVPITRSVSILERRVRARAQA